MQFQIICLYKKKHIPYNLSQFDTEYIKKIFLISSRLQCSFILNFCVCVCVLNFCVLYSYKIKKVYYIYIPLLKTLFAENNESSGKLKQNSGKRIQSFQNLYIINILYIYILFLILNQVDNLRLRLPLEHMAGHHCHHHCVIRHLLVHTRGRSEKETQTIEEEEGRKKDGIIKEKGRRGTAGAWRCFFYAFRMPHATGWLYNSLENRKSK